MRPTQSQSGLLLTELVDIGMVDLSAEEHLGWDHGVVLGQEELCLKHASLVDGVCRSSNLDEEMSAVVLRWLSVNSHNWLLGKTLGFLNKVSSATRRLP